MTDAIWSRANLVNLMTVVSKSHLDLTEHELFGRIADTMIQHMSAPAQGSLDQVRVALQEWVEQGYIGEDGECQGAAAYAPRLYKQSIAALAAQPPAPSMGMREALIAAKCTSPDGTFVHASMEDVLRAAQPPAAPVEMIETGPVTVNEYEGSMYELVREQTCPGGIDPGFDECPKCGATMDDECRHAAPAAYAGTAECKEAIQRGCDAVNQDLAQARSSAGIGDVRQKAEDAIRTFCNSLGGAAVQMSHGEERIYYAGISLKALSAAVALAVRDVPQELPVTELFEREGIARCLFYKAMKGHAQWDEMAEPHKDDWRVHADAWILETTDLIEMSRSLRSSPLSRPLSRTGEA